MNAMHELLTTKDDKNVLQFHKEKYFYNEKSGGLKNKYQIALNKLAKENIIYLNAEFNQITKKWDWNWIFKN